MSKPDERDDLQSMLADLPTREPSPMLDARIASTLEERTGSAGPRANRALVLRGAAIAALVVVAAAVAVSIALLPPTPDGPERAADPDRADLGALAERPEAADTTPADPIVATTDRPEPTHLTWTRDLGEQSRYTPSGQPYRAMIRDTVDQRTWYEPDTGVTRQLSLPTQELIVVKQTTF
ncbi:MAG: hypothetical protein ACE37H_12985 [Phycisphaeraceae bacterium]